MAPAAMIPRSLGWTCCDGWMCIKALPCQECELDTYPRCPHWLERARVTNRNAPIQRGEADLPTGMPPQRGERTAAACQSAPTLGQIHVAGAATSWQHFAFHDLVPRSDLLVIVLS